jgi:hypothetical protein
VNPGGLTSFSLGKKSISAMSGETGSKSITVAQMVLVAKLLKMDWILERQRDVALAGCKRRSSKSSLDSHINLARTRRWELCNANSAAQKAQLSTMEKLGLCV